MQTIVKFYRASSSTFEGLTIVAEQKINESLLTKLPAGSVVRSITPQLTQLGTTYHLIVTVLIDVPDTTPKAQLGFHLN